MRKLAARIALAAALCGFASAESSLPLVPSDSGFVLGVEWRRIIDSSLGATLTEQLGKSDLSQIPGMKGLQEALLHDLDSVLIAVPSAGLTGATKQPPALVIAKGKFEIATLRGFLGGKGQTVEKYHTVELLVPPASSPKSGDAENRIAFLDSNTIIAGDRAQVRAAIDRVSAKRLAPVHGGILEGAAELAATNDFWMILNVPADAAKDIPSGMSQMFSGVKSAQVGMSFQEGLAMRINLRAKDETSAQSLAQAAQGLVAMAALNQDASSGPSALETLKKIRIRPEGSLVKLELALDRTEFEKILKEAQATRGVTPPKANPEVPKPAGSKSIRISGLDGGPLEVPLSGAKK